MAEAIFASPRPGSGSPPPNCAICLGTCSNKCYSDSCMHEFCFKCLLEWSKIKAECPLCKQTFKSIIHNIKSISEYDEHIVETVTVEDNRYLDNGSLIYLPPATPQALHQYHFRTTFTVDTHGEHAIQQMLLSHPLLTLGAYNADRYNSHHRRRRGDTSTTFRRSIYNQNLWVYAPPDITGRYREVSPTFFRNNPAARTRLVPWLNRELNALLYENTQHVMHLVDIIMDHLLRQHICSTFFRTLLHEYLGHKTDHFIHEFYNFMRSPFDMIGYDRHVIYTERPRSPTPLIDISDYDSDVIIVSPTSTGANQTENQRSTDPIVIDLLDSDSDVPVIVSEEPSPTTTTTTTTTTTVTINHNDDNNVEDSDAGRKPVLPLKLRIKLRRNSREKNKRSRRWHRVGTHQFSSSSSSSSSTSSSSSSRSSKGYEPHHRRAPRRMSTSNRRRRDTQTENDSSDDDLPLSTLASTSTATSATSSLSSKWKKSKRSHSGKKKLKRSTSKRVKSELDETSSRVEVKDYNSDDDLYDRKPNVKSKVRDVSKDKAGPSSSSGRVRLKGVFRREESGNLWYSRPCIFDSNDDSSDN